jgi:hypothetical protein
MHLEIRLLIGLHGNQQSMSWNLSLLIFFVYIFSLFLILVFHMFMLLFISSLPQLAWEKRFDADV